jgi:hypothetical protein
MNALLAILVCGVVVVALAVDVAALIGLLKAKNNE